MKSERKTPRSPLEGKVISRQPGQSLVQRFYVDEFAKFTYTFGVACGGISVLLAFAAIVKFVPKAFWLTAIAMLPTLLALVAWQYFQLKSASRNYILGVGGERLVADQLRELERLGCEVIHDVPSSRPGSNIDHVVVGPPGVFVLETKTRTKNGDAKIAYDGDRLTIDGLDITNEIQPQVEACCEEIKEEIRSMTGKTAAVRGVVLFPVWFVENPRPTQHRLWVFNPKAFVAFLQYESRVLDDAAITIIASQLRRSSHNRARAQAEIAL